MFLLQTYHFGSDQLEQRGYAREFSSREDAEDYARHNVTGNRHTIIETPLRCDECGSTKRDTELSGIADPICCEVVL